VLRAGSGLVLAAAVVALVLGGRIYGAWVVVVVAGGLALWEFRQLSAGMGLKAPSWLLYPIGFYFAFSGTVLRRVPVELVLSAALIIGLTAFLFLPARRGGLGRWAMGLAGALYVGIPFNYYLLLYETPRWPRGLAWLLVTVGTVAVGDVAAYFVGRALGRHPFFPAVSPNKTLEGAVAGVICCGLGMVVSGVALLGLGPWHGVVLGLLVGLCAVFGDLVESQMKRLAGVKDSGRLIPGHGGVLDRIDSLLFAPVVVFFYASYLHLL
jgi:phosphatidate cytidylyltransferase